MDEIQRFLLSKTTSIDEQYISECINIFPNPATNILTIENTYKSNVFKIIQVDICDISGRIIQTETSPFSGVKNLMCLI